MEKKWITYLLAVKGHPVGETVQVDATVADTLIENEIAKAAQAPEENDFKAALKSIAQETALSMVAELRKGGNGAGPGVPSEKKSVIYAECKRFKTLESFSNNEAGYEKAYRFGMWAMANATKNSQQFQATWATKWCQEHGLGLNPSLETKATRENNAVSAGYLVPDEFENDLIDLREKYGVFRKNAKKVPMISDTRSDPRRRGGIQAYWVGESQAGKYADKTWDRVRLTAKKLMTLTRISNEVNEDAVINIGDDIADEAAYAFANEEDTAGFTGTGGGATNGGIVGVAQQFLNLVSGVTANLGNALGVTVAAAGTGGSWTGITLANFNSVVGTLPEFADNQKAAWYCHRSFWGSVMQKLATAAGGNKVDDIVNGARQKSFLGYPVIISQVMPKVPANNTAYCYLGDLSMAASFGDRRSTSLLMSDVADGAFTQDEIVIRATERIDINVHDVGTLNSGTAPDPIMGLTAGPIVALYSASS